MLRGYVRVGIFLEVASGKLGKKTQLLSIRVKHALEAIR